MTGYAMTAFDELLPRGTAIVEAEPGVCWETGLWPEEEPHIARAIDQRRREFTAGRNCARRALAALRVAPAAIGVGPAGEPLFPPGVSGSITHTGQYCAAAVVASEDIASIGIDADTRRPLPAGAVDVILRPDERQTLTIAAPFAGKLVFCIKEAFFKAYFQRAARYLDFQDAHVTLMPSERRFEIRVVGEYAAAWSRERVFGGRYAMDNARIYAAVAMMHRP
jgi:4'-phosphopantetheinyl transferase EntD